MVADIEGAKPALISGVSLSECSIKDINLKRLSKGKKEWKTLSGICSELVMEILVLGKII